MMFAKCGIRSFDRPAQPRPGFRARPACAYGAARYSRSKNRRGRHSMPFQRRQRTLDALKRLILRQCQQQPVILVCEDLHWIDRETQAFLETLIDGLASAPLLLILTYRPEYEHRWGGKSYYTQLRLDSLSPEATEEFLSNLVGDDASLISLEVAAAGEWNAILPRRDRARAGGNELAGRQPGSYRLISPLQDLPTPPSVQAILAARIDRLPARNKRLLHAASVVGKERSSCDSAAHCRLRGG